VVSEVGDGGSESERYQAEDLDVISMRYLECPIHYSGYPPRTAARALRVAYRERQYPRQTQILRHTFHLP